MQFIDKSILEAEGKQVIDALLNEAWNEEEGKYIGADYDTLSKPEFKENFRAALLREQNGFCCYCMKKLENSRKTTLEHIIPHQATKAEYDAYNHHILNDNVIYFADFNRLLREIPPARYPHDIAYHNLIASCDSKTHCNNKRGNTPIKPLIFDPNINTEVEYDNKGKAYSSAYLDDLDTLNVSGDENLIFYRWIWAEIAKNPNIDPDGLSADDIDEVILNMDYPTDFEKLINNFFGNPSKKPELLKYRWFFDYYREKPTQDI